jgi:hypothetical protein
LPSSQHRLWSL